MLKRIYGVRDKKIDSFETFVILANDRFAARSFEVSCKDPNSILFMYPDDFELYCLGEVDTDTGLVSAFEPMKYICVGSDFKAGE